jgi:hypothetical protein
VIDIHANAVAAFVWLSTSMVMPPPYDLRPIGEFDDNAILFLPRQCKCANSFVASCRCHTVQVRKSALTSVPCNEAISSCAAQVTFTAHVDDVDAEQLKECGF